MFYVHMIDNFMSGWGNASGKVNILCIKCDTQDDAELIAMNARKRPEMDHVGITRQFPSSYNSAAYYVSYKSFDELGSIWKKEEECE